MSVTFLEVIDNLGGSIPWKRWWIPSGFEPRIENGLLIDPDGRYARFLNPDVLVLPDLDDTRCAVLLGDSGSGKSDELEKEARRLRGARASVVHRDLGCYPDWASLRADVFEAEAVREWAAAESGELVLLLDGFDEAFVTVRRLADGISRELRRLPYQRLSLRIAARHSAWPDRLSSDLRSVWPESFANLSLCPLSASDIALAARTVLQDDGTFVREVIEHDVGALASRPIGLRLLLLATRAEGRLPSDRLTLYRRGTEALVMEASPRRREDRDDGPPVARRVRAAEDLAAVSLLSGRTKITRRRDPLANDPASLTVDEVSADSHADLEAVWDSGLMTGLGPTITWAHRSLAEYLGARRLAQLGARAALRLISDPEEPDRVVPQLAGVATWLAAMEPAVFRVLADGEPELLLTPDLALRSHEERATLAGSLIGSLRAGVPPTGRRYYRGLTYPELAEELRPLITDTSRPHWVRREAIKIVADNGIRELDDPLVGLIETTSAAHGPHDYGEDVSLASWAALALEGVADEILVGRLTAIAADATCPAALRAHVLDLLWPKLGAAGVLARVPTDLMRSRSQLARTVAARLMAALESGEVDARVVLGWLDGHPAESHGNDRFDDLAGPVVLAVASSTPVDGDEWSMLGRFCARQAETGGRLFGWRENETDVLPADTRRRLAIATLIESCEGDKRADAFELRAAGLLRTDDLPWWFHRYGHRLDSGEPEERAAHAALTVLAVPDEATFTLAQEALTRHPALQRYVSEWFSPAHMTTYREHQERSARHDEEARRRAVDELFDRGRLHTALAASDWLGVVAELWRPTAIDDGSSRRHHHGVPLSRREPWATLDETEQLEAMTAAESFLAAPPETPGRQEADAAAAAFVLLADEAGDRLDDVPLKTLLSWLPAVLDLAGHHDAAIAMVAAVGTEFSAEVESVLLDRLRAESVGQYVTITDRFGAFATPGLTEELLRLAEGSSTHPQAMASLLQAALAQAPNEAAALALRIVRACPSSRPEPAEGQAVVVDDGDARAWLRAVHASVALLQSNVASAVFDDLLTIFRSNVPFAEDVVVRLDGPMRTRPLTALTPEQLARLYRWATESLPPRREYEPGVAYTVDPVEEFPDRVLAYLTTDPTPEKAGALDQLAEDTQDPWLCAAGRDAWQEIRSDRWTPMALPDVIEALADARRRVVAGPAHLATVVVEALDDLAEILRSDTGARREFWDRQRRTPLFTPKDEPDISDVLARRLRERLSNVVIRREVQLQPRLGNQAGEIPDIEVTVKLDSGDEVVVLLEVKANWHDEVRTALGSQLAERYLRGPRGRIGVYVVVWFAGEAWDSVDVRRKAARRSGSRDQLLRELHDRALALPVEGVLVHVRVLDLTLERDPVGPASS